MQFPFSDPENTACITCVHIMEGDADICYVTHDDDDGSWQFLCGKNHDVDEARVVGLGQIFEQDSSIGALSEMPYGCGAKRADKNSPWKGFRQSARNEDERG